MYENNLIEKKVQQRLAEEQEKNDDDNVKQPMVEMKRTYLEYMQGFLIYFQVVRQNIEYATSL